MLSIIIPQDVGVITLDSALAPPVRNGHDISHSKQHSAVTLLLLLLTLHTILPVSL